MIFRAFFFIIIFLQPSLVLGINDTRQMKDVSWEEKLGNKIDLKSEIIDINGYNKNLDQVLDPEKPTVLCWHITIVLACAHFY